MNIDNQSEEKLPNLYPIDQQFIGLGHKLQDKRRQRKRMSDQSRILQNRINFFSKQAKKTQRNINEQKKHLEQIILIRNRKEQQKLLREKLQSIRNQEISRLRMNSQQIRKQNEINRKQAIQKLLSNKKNIFLDIKQTKKMREQIKRENQYRQLSQKYMKFRTVRQSKELGKTQIYEFKLNRNKLAISHYKSKIQQEEAQKKRIKNNMSKLSQKENHLLTQLKKSYMQQDKLEGTLENAYTLQLDKLEKFLVNKPKSQQKIINKNDFQRKRKQRAMNTRQLVSNTTQMKLQIQNSKKQLEQLKKMNRTYQVKKNELPNQQQKAQEWSFDKKLKKRKRRGVRGSLIKQIQF